MQNVTNFINLLGENYYLDFIIDPYSEDVDYKKHFVLVNYEDKSYYEQTLEHIKIRQNEIISNAKTLYQKSLADLFLEVSKKKNYEIEQFLNFNIKAVKVKLNTLKNDFYIDNKKSRYCTILYDNSDTQTLETLYSKRDTSNELEMDGEFNKLVELLNSTKKPENKYYFESDYFLDFHYKRMQLLSLLPFKLFQIASKFIIELEKIKQLSPVGKLKKAKLKVEEAENTMIKKDTYFDKFCELIDDYTILKKSTAIGVMVDLEDCIKRIKSETLLELQEKGVNKDYHLEFKINEIEKLDYIKNADITFIQKWLDEYKISIEDIFNRNFNNNNIEFVIASNYNDMEAFSPEKDKALFVQQDFYFYFCKHFADELIAYFNSKKDNKENNISTKHPLPMKPFKDEFLTAFCKEISNEREIYQSPFIQCYDFGIKNFTENLKSEINENLLILPSDKITPYIDFIEDKIKNTPYFEVNNTILDKWIKKYKLQNLEFPFIENKELKQLISMSVNFHHLTEEDKALMEDIQIDFYGYAAMIEAKKIIDFLATKKTSVIKATNNIENNIEVENPNQLSINQAIILLDRLGVFNDKALENVSNVKKAKLISQLIGKNDKNIKTAIEKLELKPNEIKPNYQKDIDKIERILNNLE